MGNEWVMTTYKRHDICQPRRTQTKLNEDKGTDYERNRKSVGSGPYGLRPQDVVNWVDLGKILLIKAIYERSESWQR